MKIKLEIDIDGNKCGECPFCDRTDNVCLLFKEELRSHERWGQEMEWFRCTSCTKCG